MFELISFLVMKEKMKKVIHFMVHHNNGPEEQGQEMGHHLIKSLKEYGMSNNDALEFMEGVRRATEAFRQRKGL